jgi:putative hydrolase of the HAD superfamily
MSPLRAVFLDIGDTVMRPNPSWEHIYAIAFEEHGVQVSIDDLRAALRRAYHHGGWGFEEGFDATEETSFRRTMEIDQVALSELGIGLMPETFYRRLSDLFMLTSNWHIFADVLPALDALKARGLIIGAVSNWVWQLPELLHSLELVRHFEFIAASARVGFEKPHPEIFRHALEQAGAKPSEAIHVGDHLDADVAGARGVGIGAVLIDRRGRFKPEQIPAEVPVIATLTELLPLVDARLDRASA